MNMSIDMDVVKQVLNCLLLYKDRRTLYVLDHGEVSALVLQIKLHSLSPPPPPPEKKKKRRKKKWKKN